VSELVEQDAVRLLLFFDLRLLLTWRDEHTPLVLIDM
jgi:hypothetical protein